MGYFRAILKANEISHRALQLTAHAAVLNPANYTVWFVAAVSVCISDRNPVPPLLYFSRHYRRVLVDALKVDLTSELEFCANVTRDNVKGYQTWYCGTAMYSIRTIVLYSLINLAYTHEP